MPNARLSSTDPEELAEPGHKSRPGVTEHRETADADGRQQLQRAVVFQHIPKTAGVSTRSVMSCNFRLDEILHVEDSHWKDAEFAAKVIAQYRFIHGHLHFDFVKDLLRRAHVVTFLRDPVERVLSQYFFLRNQDPKSLSDSARFTVEQARALSIEAFAKHDNPVIASMVSNFQVQMLLSQSQAERPSRTWVSSALENLKNYYFVGLSDPELMPDSISMLSLSLGWVPTREPPRVNHTARASNAGELVRARKIIEARNKLDLLLYREMCEDFRVRTASLEKTRGGYRVLLEEQLRHYETGLASPVTMDQPLRCWGWHDREVNSDREYWRCGAQLRAGLELRVPTAVPFLILLFGLKSAHSRVSVEDTVIEAQGRPLPARWFIANNRWVLATVVSREDVGANGIVSLEIVCKERGDAPPVVSRTPDSRFVTIALQSIEILTEKNVASSTLELLRQSICETRQVSARESRVDPTDLKVQQDEVESRYVALLERAERAETYSESLKSELAKQKNAYQVLSAAREQAQAEGSRLQTALLERARRAETYSDSLIAELKRRQDEWQIVLTAREGDREALFERAQRAEAYSDSLSAELKKQQDQYQALLTATQQAQAETAKHQSELLERTQRAEAYSDSLSAELKSQQDQHQALLMTSQQSQAEAGKYQSALLERAQRAETYSDSLNVELKSQQDQYRALLSAHELSQAEASNYHAALLERAERAESYSESLRIELKKHLDGR